MVDEQSTANNGQDPGATEMNNGQLPETTEQNKGSRIQAQEKLQQNRRHRLKSGLWWLAITACLVVMAVFGLRIVLQLWEYHEGDKTYQEILVNSGLIKNVDLLAMDPQKLLAENKAALTFSTLKSINSDFIGWLYCPGTVLSYPLVQGDDNEYYLTHLYDGTENVLGTLFMDCRNAADFSDQNTIIYGHNMKNDSMFALLNNYVEQDFYDAHPVWYLLTEGQNYEIDLLCILTSDIGSQSFTFNFGSQEAYAEYLDFLGRSTYFTPQFTVSAADHLVTFSTCVSDVEKRLLLIGRLKEMND